MDDLTALVDQAREAFARVVTIRYQLMAAAEIGYGLQIGNAAYVEEGRRALREHMSQPLT